MPLSAMVEDPLRPGKTLSTPVKSDHRGHDCTRRAGGMSHRSTNDDQTDEHEPSNTAKRTAAKSFSGPLE